MNSEGSVEALPNLEANSLRRAVWAAFLSVFVPGLGQLFLRKRRSGWIFLSIFAVLIWLFLPPFRLPTFYPAVAFLIFALAGLTISASWNALRSGPGLRRAGSLGWLLILLPLGCILAASYWGIALHLGGFHVFKVPSTAMEPTIVPGDLIMVDMRYFEHHSIQDGDVVILKSPLYPGVLWSNALWQWEEIVSRVLIVGYL